MSAEDFTQADEVQPQEGQGLTPASTSEVQPEGQGLRDDTTTGLYDLSTVDEAHRADVERIAKQIEENANRRFREHAEYRKGWAPYEELGLNGVDPAELKTVIDFAQALSGDEDTARDAVLELARQVGLVTDDEDPAQAEPEPDDPTSALERRLAAIEAAEQERTQAAAVEEAKVALAAEWSEVEKLNGKPFTDDEATRLADLAARFVEDDEPIKAAWEFINSISGSAERALISKKRSEPGPAEGAGRASTAVKPPETFEEAEAAFRQRTSQQSHATL